MAIKFIKKVVPSNKTETLPENHHAEDGSEQTGLKPFIDKISIVVPISAEDGSDVFKEIWTQIQDTDVFQDAGPKAKNGGFKLAKRICLADSKEKPLLQLAYANKIAQKLRLEFNPRKVTPKGVTQLQAVLVSVVPNGWGFVRDLGHVTRLDVAVDIPETRPAMFGLLPEQGLTTKSWSVDGQLQTFVAGKKGGKQGVIYNKKEQRLAQGKEWSGKATTRVEIRLPSPSLGTLAELPQLANPFALFSLVQIVPGPPPGDKKWIWELFKDAVSLRGLPAALALLPKERRTHYRAYLKKFPHQKWDPAAIWQHWATVVQQSELLP